MRYGLERKDLRPWRPSQKWWLLLGVLFIFACSGESSGCGGCDCAASVPYPDAAPAVKNGVQVRVSEHGFNFVEANLDGIIGQFLEGGQKTGHCL